MSRELIAYGLIAISLLGLMIWSSIAWRRRQRTKLRRRGIKTYGH